MSVVLLILALFMFIGLVVVHEFGHYIAARKGGVEVEEFGIGFPPKAWGKKLKSGMLFTINWLPLGGFVKLKGEHDSATAKGSFGAASLKTKISIMVAGVIMNLITAFVIFTALALLGMPKLIDNQFTVDSDTKITKNEVLVGAVEENSPASKAGLQQRDKIVSITADEKNKPIATSADLPIATSSQAGKKIIIAIERKGESKNLTATLRTEKEVEASKKTDNPVGYLGVSPAEFTLRKSTWSAPIVAAGVIKQFTFETFKGLGSALSNVARGNGKEASQQVSGPVGIFVILQQGSLLGVQFVMIIIAIISLTLAIMNILPIPALDGGRLFVTLLFKALGKPLTQETEDKIHGTGFLMLMGLFLLITIVDIRRIF
jgi:regulator of sigma E protease